MQFETTKKSGSPILTAQELRERAQRLGFKDKLSDADVGRLLNDFDQEKLGGLSFRSFLRVCTLSLASPDRKALSKTLTIARTLPGRERRGGWDPTFWL